MERWLDEREREVVWVCVVGVREMRGGLYGPNQGRNAMGLTPKGPEIIKALADVTRPAQPELQNIC